jgi:uncharacterized membrane protein
MVLRSARERLLQTVLYELGGLVLVLPCYALVTGLAVAESLALLVAVSIATMSWACLHNLGFDYVEALITGRVASDRPQVLRLVHAASTEVTSIIVTTPVIVLAGGFGWWEAVLVDIGLTLFYAAYAYGFHVVFDKLRPMRPAQQRKAQLPASHRQRTPQRQHVPAPFATRTAMMEKARPRRVTER